MAGYRTLDSLIPPDNEYVNATAYNSQIKEQRFQLTNTFGNSLNRSELATSGSLGCAKEVNGFFSQFNSREIMQKANDEFGNISYNGLNTDGTNLNPDFRGEVALTRFKSFNDIMDEAPQPEDKPGIGIGPNLNSPGSSEDLDLALSGQLTRQESEGFNDEMSANNRGRGYGWRSDRHKSSTIGNYLQRSYVFYSGDPTTTRLGQENTDPRQGERIDTNAIAYDQPEV